MESIRDSIRAIDNHVGSSTFGRIFRLEGSGHVSVGYTPKKNTTKALIHSQDMEIRGTKFSTELRAGLTTFFTMSYIIAVNVRYTPSTKSTRLITTGNHFGSYWRQLPM